MSDVASDLGVVIYPAFRSLIPPLSGEEYQQLEENLKAEGCRDALVVWDRSPRALYAEGLGECKDERCKYAHKTVPVAQWEVGDGIWLCPGCGYGIAPRGDDILLDGHNRLEICERLDIPYKTKKIQLDGYEAAADWIDKNQLGRRNLTPDQASLLRGRRYNRAKKAHGGDRKSKDQNDLLIESTAVRLAKQHGVSAPTIKRDGQFASAVEKAKRLDPDIERKVTAGTAPAKAAVVAAARLLETEPEKAREVLERRKSIVEIKREIKEEARREERKQMKPVEEVPGKYGVLLADPPWQYDFSLTDSRGIENQYDTLSVEDICALKVGEVSESNAVLFLWATSPKLPEALRVMAAWGFAYKTSMVWVKDKIGMGYYARQKHEFVLIGTRGNPEIPLPEDRPESVIVAPRGKHSEKPECVYGLIEKMYPTVARLELFARKRRERWASWGDQAR